MTSSARPWVLWTATASLHEQVEAQRLAGRRLLVAAGELGQVADEVGELLELHEDVVDEHGAVLGAQLVDAADHLEVRPEAGERCPQLVGRIEHQLALGAGATTRGLRASG